VEECNLSIFFFTIFHTSLSLLFAYYSSKSITKLITLHTQHYRVDLYLSHPERFIGSCQP